MREVIGRLCLILFGLGLHAALWGFVLWAVLLAFFPEAGMDYAESLALGAAVTIGTGFEAWARTPKRKGRH